VARYNVERNNTYFSHQASTDNLSVQVLPAHPYIHRRQWKRLIAKVRLIIRYDGGKETKRQDR
jgi:hypothetical protein